MPKEIEITIGLNGEVELDLQGFHGKGCSQLVDDLTKAMGKTVKRSQKCEYFKPEVKQKQKVKRA